MTTTLAFQAITFDIVDRLGQPWLRLPQIGVALGYANPHKVQQVYDRNTDEFNENMTAVVDLDTAGGKQKVRIFSLRGAHLLGMLSRTPVAKQFRRWVLDVLEKETAGQQTEMNPHLAIRNAVHAAAGGDRSKYAALYNRLYRHFQVGSYKDITVAQCPAALEYIRSIEGEFIPAAPVQQALIPAVKPLTINIPKSAVYQHRFKHQQHLLTLNVFIDGFDVHGNPLRQLFRQLWQAKEEGRPVVIENIEGAVLTHEVIQSLAQDYRHALADLGRNARDSADRGCYLPIGNPPVMKSQGVG